MDNKKVENKKQMSNKKKFWVGMSALAAVGIITATVAYFKSSHIYDPNSYQTRDYSVETQNIIDEGTAATLYSGQTVNTDVTVENKGEVPILTRISYFDTNKAVSEGNSAKGENLSTSYPTNDVPYKFNLVEGAEGKFLYNSEDGCYYYKGILDTASGEGVKKVQHLDSVTCNSANADFNYSGSREFLQGDDTWGDNTAGRGSRQTTTFTGKDFSMKVVIETVQATGADGNPLESSVVSGADAATLKGYWTAMNINGPVLGQ